VTEKLLSRQIRSALGWGLLTNTAGRLLSVGTGIVMARLLTPREFGIFAVALIAAELLMSLNDGGMIAALVRDTRDVRCAARTATTLIWSSSLAVYILLFITAPVFASAIGAPDAAAPVRVLGLVVLIDGVSAVPAGLLTRGLQQDRRAIGELAGILTVCATSVALGVLGLGPWALVWGRIAGNLVSAVLLIALAPFRPLPGLDRTIGAAYFRFGAPMAGASLITFALLYAPSAIVGHALGPVALGFYAIAYNVSTWPLTLVSQTARRVAMVGFARLHHDAHLQAVAFVRALLLMLLIMVPLCAALAVAARPLIHNVYGAVWEPAAPVLSWLALVAAVRVVAYLVEDYLAARGRSRMILMLHSVWLLLLVPALIAGAQIGGLVTVGVAHALVAAVMLPAYVAGAVLSGVRLRMLRAATAPVWLATPWLRSWIAVRNA
jgi:PST family polysaccharide transporter